LKGNTIIEHRIACLVLYSLTGVFAQSIATITVIANVGEIQDKERVTGEILLEVINPAGKAVEAAGKLSNLSTGVERGFQTDAHGRQTLNKLPFGRYRLEVSSEGFSTQTVLIDVLSATTITRTVTLTVGRLAFSVDVVAATPLPGSDLVADEIPAPVQVAPARDIQASNALDISDFLQRPLKGVHLNEIQGNPYQADLNYRGYTASPLLGTPQGLSVYLDGVRLNQPFGDVLSWDLIPGIAIAGEDYDSNSNVNEIVGKGEGESVGGFSICHFIFVICHWKRSDRVSFSSMTNDKYKMTNGKFSHSPPLPLSLYAINLMRDMASRRRSASELIARLIFISSRRSRASPRTDRIAY
jgi:TonB-dependent Receptor Plug Domain/Carboxypeptidase regulatory-like domain